MAKSHVGVSMATLALMAGAFGGTQPSGEYAPSRLGAAQHSTAPARKKARKVAERSRKRNR